MKLFQIDYKRLVVLLLPTLFRKEVMVTFLRVLTAPVITLYNQFAQNRESNLYRLKMNGQVYYLRRLLNDAFPAANNHIRIEDGQMVGVWRYAWAKDYDPYKKYLLADGVLLWNRLSILAGISGFTVVAPHSIYSVNNDSKIKSLLNTYKLLSKSYTIIYE